MLAGAIGKELARAIVKSRGNGSVIAGIIREIIIILLRQISSFIYVKWNAALHRTPLPEDLRPCVLSEFGVDIQDRASVRALLDRYCGKIDVVWNLAAPLSVDTANDPDLAFRITVGGMRNVLECMKEVGLKKICFSDSIGSFGRTSPRDNATASWLVHHPEQDPGSDYGVQKRMCRGLLHEYSQNHGFDTRFVVIPGVLHSEAVWGGGTTEYVLDAVKAAAEGHEYICPIASHTRLPMIYIEDLVKGMIAIQDCNSEKLSEPDAGYCLAGFSLCPEELFIDISKHFPSFQYKYDSSVNEFAAAFSETWPDSLSGEEAARDFGFRSHWALVETLTAISTAAAARRVVSR
jgi:nucleoside-diphosphate-sugar epimerase